MRETFTSGSVGRASGNRCLYPDEIDSISDNISVSFGDGGNPSPLGEEQFIYCRYATL